MESMEKNNLSAFQKIVLSVLVVLLLFVVLGSYANGETLIAFICLCLVGIITGLLLGKIDKKYTWSIVAVSIIVPIVAGAISASSEGDTSDSNNLKQEMTKEKVKTENKSSSKDSKQQTLSPKEKEVADAGYNKGSMFGMAADDNAEFKNMLDLAEHVDGMEDKANELLERVAGQQYDIDYHAPNNEADKRLKRIYVENFIKGMNETMETMDKLGN